MAEFKLDRFKYNWRGEWQPGEEYTRDDIIRINGRSYVCLISHISKAVFAEDLEAILPDSDPPQPEPKWVVMTASKYFYGMWATNIAYNIGDVVLFGGTLWECTKSHISAAFEDNEEKWKIFARHISYQEEWQSNQNYGYGALLKYNGIVYKCIKAHTSQTYLEDDADAWEIFVDGIQYRGDFVDTTEYRQNDLVRYGGSIFRCTETHISLSTLDDTKFVLEFPGNQFSGDWNSTAAYNQGDIVTYGGFLWYAEKNSVDQNPSNDDSTVYWSIIAKTQAFAGQWDPNAQYKPGDIVHRGGNLLMAKQDIGISQGDDSAKDYLDGDLWELVVSGKNNRSSWVPGQLYSRNDVVNYLGTSWICTEEHQSEPNNYPGDNGSGYDYWDLLIQAGLEGGLRAKGDLLSYGLKDFLTKGDGSTLGDVAVPIGEEAQFLSINSDNEVFWRNLSTDTDVVYVAENGIDEPGRGLDATHPFRTVRYACEYVEDNLDGKLAKVQIATGTYQEAGPIIVPAKTVVMGDELRATVVSASDPDPRYEGDIEFVRDYLLRTKQWLEMMLLNQSIMDEIAPGNTLTQITNLPPSGQTAINVVNQLIDDWQNYVEYRVDDGAIVVDVTGTNDLTTVTQRSSAARIIDANKEFLACQIAYYIIDRYPNETFELNRLKNDARSLLRGLIRDLNYDGNYATIQSARRYVSYVNGSRLEDLFYMRDTTGLRQMTIYGLEGNLNPPGVFDLYQRPTGGACVSLDPGWGPDDERTWIKNRSPYIQGVTNIGDRCVGMKVDGALHNGGNKSMTANDFTQVLSDGIGAWITNNARVELVSVFTYYNQVGYLAENGGVIRATNGNNSYGDFGSVADGNDPNEIPEAVTVNNRENEAQVGEAFAGGANDHIYLFEYTNCGEEYTQADATITGAGDDADVEFRDFRSSSLFEARLINTQGSGQEGGAGYLSRQGSAQITPDSTSTIRLSATDPTQFLSEIEGMRILITSGQGAGQYAYIVDFDAVTRDVTVRRESDGELGWDHIVPGTPIRASLDSTARYRIEPRIETTPPTYRTFVANLQSDTEYNDIVFGGTRNIFNNVSVGTGTGDTYDDDPAEATFNITRANREYELVLSLPGRGYAVGDQFVITGDRLDGVTPDNDITITVSEVSDDSSSSIVNYTFEGKGRRGRWMTVANPNIASYSDDGVNYTNELLGFSGDWVRIVPGHDRFVAIARNDNRCSFTFTGESWTTRALPTTEDWIDGAYGNGRFVIISQSSNNVSYSDDGLTWSLTDIPDQASGDSSTVKWDHVTYGNGKFVAISSNFTDVAYSSDGISWTRVEEALDQNTNWDIVGLEYGNNRFLALSSNGFVTYSIDAVNWYLADRIFPDDVDITYQIFNFTKLRFSQGVFAAIGQKFTMDEIAIQLNEDDIDFIYTTEYGVLWERRLLASAKKWRALGGTGELESRPTWQVLANTSSSGRNKLYLGKQALLRADIFQGKFQSMKIWDPGSGYEDDMTITVTDTQYTTEAEFEQRFGNNVLAQPDFVNRGAGYRTSTSTISITGNGYADIIEESNTLTLDGIGIIPGPGVQIRINGILDDTTDDPDDLKLYVGVTATDLGDDGSGNNTRTVRFSITPRLRNENNLAHGTQATLRRRYSQCRISGHDFLDIGTGNFLETNYPELYAGGAYFTSAPENEVQELNGGRVFYVSTDQDGNFRAGELFAVEQATGIVTISAEFFDLDGLSELALGGVRLGGSGAVVREFSTDATMSEDSNNVVPTQKAIATFLADRLSVGGENLETNAFVAGRVRVGTDANVIEMTDDSYLNINVPVTFEGSAGGNPVSIDGTIISQMLFLRNINNEL